MPIVIRAENIGKLYRINHGTRSPPLHRQRQEGQSLASAGNGGLQVVPRGMAAPTAGVDDTG